MASYDEISTLLINDTLRNRVTIAIIIRANALINAGTPTPEEIKWAAAVFSDPETESIKAFRAVLAAKNTLAKEAISSATDADIQLIVDTVSTTLVTAHSAT